MSRQKIAVSAVIFLVAAALFLAVFLYSKASRNEPVEGEPFSLSDYQGVLNTEAFSSGRRVGRIEGVQDAAEKAESVWLEVYGETVEDEKPYVVSRDSENGAWFVTGSLPCDFWSRTAKGGTACILIRDDGTVLAVWHEK